MAKSSRQKKRKDHTLHNFAWVLLSGYYSYLFTSWTEVIEMSRSLSFPALLKYLSKILNKVREQGNKSHQFLIRKLKALQRKSVQCSELLCLDLTLKRDKRSTRENNMGTAALLSQDSLLPGVTTAWGQALSCLCLTFQTICFLSS